MSDSVDMRNHPLRSHVLPQPHSDPISCVRHPAPYLLSQPESQGSRSCWEWSYLLRNNETCSCKNTFVSKANAIAKSQPDVPIANVDVMASANPMYLVLLLTCHSSGGCAIELQWQQAAILNSTHTCLPPCSQMSIDVLASFFLFLQYCARM